MQIIRQSLLYCFDYLDKIAHNTILCNLMLSISVLTRQTQMTKEKPGLWPGQICLTRNGTSPGSGLICLTKYELSKILDLKDLNFFHPWVWLLWGSAISMSYVPLIAVDVFIRSVTKLWKPNIDGRMYDVKRLII